MSESETQTLAESSDCGARPGAESPPNIAAISAPVHMRGTRCPGRLLNMFLSDFWRQGEDPGSTGPIAVGASDTARPTHNSLSGDTHLDAGLAGPADNPAPPPALAGNAPSTAIETSRLALLEWDLCRASELTASPFQNRSLFAPSLLESGVAASLTLPSLGEPSSALSAVRLR